MTLLERLEEYWRSDKTSSEKMWDSWEDEHRSNIILGLLCVPEWTSLYELGCGSGPNLRLIQKHWPDKVLGGSDMNEGHRQWLNEKLWIRADPNPMPWTPKETWDVLLSMYTLAYAEGHIAYETLKNANAKYVVLAEPSAHVAPHERQGVSDIDGVMPCFVHEYLSILQAANWKVMFRWPIYPHRHGLNCLIVAERS